MKSRQLVLVTILFSLITFSSFSQESLKYLSVNHALKNTDNAVELQLSGITEALPEEISKLKRLKVVRLINLSSSYDLADAFRKLSKIPTIKELYLYGNAHKQLPDHIALFGNLRKIHLDPSLRGNLVPTLLKLSKITTLEYIDLIGFDLQKLPEEILLFKNLKGLGLGDNRSLDYEHTFEMLSKLEKFEELNLDYNVFKSFPASISKLKNLKKLDMEMMSCKFNNPETYKILAKCSKLEELNLSGNFLGNLPKEIVEIKSLKILNINGNGIVEKNYERLKTMLPKVKIINNLPV